MTPCSGVSRSVSKGSGKEKHCGVIKVCYSRCIRTINRVKVKINLFIKETTDLGCDYPAQLGINDQSIPCDDFPSLFSVAPELHYQHPNTRLWYLCDK